MPFDSCIEQLNHPSVMSGYGQEILFTESPISELFYTVLALK
jgi:hypothetical protein